eukprot:7055027-Alexandrium_andersonii.AAC.1
MRVDSLARAATKLRKGPQSTSREALEDTCTEYRSHRVDDRTGRIDSAGGRPNQLLNIPNLLGAF